jgi:hypothetical protein
MNTHYLLIIFMLFKGFTVILRNEPIFRVTEASSFGLTVIAFGDSTLFPFALYLLTFVRNEPIWGSVSAIV